MSEEGPNQSDSGTSKPPTALSIRLFSPRSLFLALIGIAGVVSVITGASMACRRSTTPLSLPVESHYIRFFGFELSSVPDLAIASAFLTVGTLAMGIASLLALKRFSLRLLLTLILIGATAGSMPHVLIPTSDVHLDAYLRIDANPGRLLGEREQLEPASVLSIFPRKLWLRLRIDATNISVVQWSVEDSGSGCEARLVLRPVSRSATDQLGVLVRAYTVQIARLAVKSASEQTRESQALRSFRSADINPAIAEYVFGGLSDSEVKAWLDELSLIATAKRNMEHVDGHPAYPLATQKQLLERYKAYIKEHEAQAEEILKRM